MNRVAVDSTELPLWAWNLPLKRFAHKVLSELGKDKWDLSVLLCGDETIADLNSRYRGKPQATDVLSFSMDEGKQFPSGPSSGTRFLPGDIVISLDSMRENSRRHKIDEDEELRRLLIHGILHLGGMDHRSNNKTEPMLLLQEEILAKLTGEHILGSNA